MLDFKLEEGYIAASCKHVVYCPAISEGGSDLHFVKENLVKENGELVPNVRLIKNYQRPFFVTKDHPSLRNHRDKQEYEFLKNVNKYECTQSQLLDKIRKVTQQGQDKKTLKQLARSPYLYGADISAAACIKNDYFTKWPEQANTKSTVAAYDIETCMLNKPYKDQPIIAGLTFGKHIVVGILEDFVSGINDPINKVIEACHVYLSEFINEQTVFHMKVCKDPGAVCEFVVRKAHDLKPDFISIWNIDFDVPRTISALETYGYDTADVFSDPSVPKSMKRCEYKKGPVVKRKDNGDETPLHWTEQWHTLFTPSSSYWIDAGCVYRRIRVAAGMEESYKLDYILHKHLGKRKLKFDDLLTEEASWIQGGTAEWHVYMQEKHPIEYIVYNIFDCIGLELLDAKTTDLSLTLPVLIEISEYQDYKSQPKRIADDLHFVYLSKGKVICSVSDRMPDENDELIVGRNNWIVTLSAERMINHGIRIVEESPELQTEIYLNSYDIDAVGTYPNAQVASNSSKRCTVRELISIEGLTDKQRRMVGVNLTGGRANGYSIGRIVHKGPSFSQLLNQWDKEKA